MDAWHSDPSKNFFKEPNQLVNYFLRSWDCDTCKADVGAVADVYVKATDWIVKHLEGEGFCADPDLGLEGEQLEYCKTVIKGFMPPALKTIMGKLKADANNVCAGVYEGICSPM